MRSPFKFLDAYTLEDKNVFFGRDKEVEELYDAVNKNRLVLVYGQSGMGKTSLVQCGLANRFDATDWYPLFIRRQDDINRVLQQTVEKAAKCRLEGNLVDGLQRLNAFLLRPIYLIFDQLEEFLILGSQEEQHIFIQSLQKILKADELSCHIILVLREEYLAHLYPFERAIPTLFDRRLRVEPMTNTRVEEVLRYSFVAFNISLEDPEDNITQIIENVSASRSGIQLPYLQVYLDMLWRNCYAKQYIWAKRKDYNFSSDYPLLHFYTSDINELGQIERVLELFLNEQETIILEEITEEYEGFPEEGIYQILDIFVTEEGTKRPVAFQREGEGEDSLIILENFNSESGPRLPPRIITNCLKILEERRLLRFSTNSIELAHDSLAKYIESQRTEEQRLLKDTMKRLNAHYLEWKNTGEFLTNKQISNITDLTKNIKLKLEPHIADFVKESEIFNKKKQIYRWVSAFLFIISIAIFVYIAIISYWSFNQRSTKIYTYIMGQAQEDIHSLRYEEALEKYQSISEWGIQQAELSRAFMEIAYFYNEAGRHEKAKGLIDQAILLEETALWTGNDLEKIIDRIMSQLKNSSKNQHGSPWQVNLQSLRNELKKLDAKYYTQLQKRYFPDMVKVSGDYYWMGCDSVELKKILGIQAKCTSSHLPSHQVELSSFQIARTETTSWQYYLFTEATKHNMPPSPPWQWYGDNPIVNVSWEDVAAYANWVSKQLNLENAISKDVDGNYHVKLHSPGFRFPTEAEWEYASRGGNISNGYIYSGSNTIDEVAWWNRNVVSQPQPVSRKKANELGLYDMSGNVSELCWDWYSANYYSDSLFINPSGPENPSNSSRVLRGGAWGNSENNCRVSYRDLIDPQGKANSIGFRLVQGN